MLKEEEIDERTGLPKRKRCTRCLKGIMELFDEVESDERSVGDEFDGDFEIGQTHVIYYECNDKNCRESEIIKQEFSGSGILR